MQGVAWGHENIHKKPCYKHVAMAIASNGRYTTKLCERKPEMEVVGANVLAQRDTEPQLSGRRLQAVDGVLEEVYD